MKVIQWIVLALIIVAAAAGFRLVHFYAPYEIGEPIDSLNHVKVYFNGSTSNVLERNLTADNYNLGLKYQCVEFVKRYYYEYLHHKMPDSYGHAKDFFNPRLGDGDYNNQRDLTQYTNSSKSKPEINDIVVLDKSKSNPYGHVAIVAATTDNYIEVVQQNPGKYAPSRAVYSIELIHEKWVVQNDRVLGWLRLEK